ncbi:MAG TPA: PLD nuclease N-terminal domain-containing protein [bacterium]|nr:PLD nuclease N-terminal domain-containing protein [bacterium]
MPVFALVLWVAWTTVACLSILDSEQPPRAQALWCLAQLVLPFLGWPLYLLFGTGYLAAMDAQLWPHRHAGGLAGDS